MVYLPYIVFACLFITSIVINVLVQRRASKNLDSKNKALTALRKLDEIMMASLSLEDVAQRVTDAIAFELKFEIGVLSLVDEKLGILRRVAMSRTPVGLETHKFLPIPYGQITVSLSSKDNLLVQSVIDGQKRITHNLHEVFKPVLDEATARRIQDTIGIKTSMIYPVSSRGKRIGAMIFSVKKDEKDISDQEFDTIQKLVDVMGIALGNAQIYQQLRETERELTDANKKLQTMDELKDEFVSVASHELRTPMTAIRSYAWMALHRSDTPLSQKMEKYIVRILMSAERLIALVNDMLNISRIESGRIEIIPEEVDIIELTKDIVDEAYYSKGLEKHIHISIMEEKLPPVFADPDKLRQVMLNIIGNAVKFVSDEGTITVSFFTDGKMVEVAVKDNGPGISKEDLSKLFRKFSRLDNSYTALSISGGTGLGLYISKNIIELMHGRIWVSSEGLGKGATFTFSLPVATKEVVEHADQFKVAAKGGEAKGLEPVAI